MERAQSSRPRKLDTSDESVMFKYLEPACRTCKNRLLRFEKRINDMREQDISDIEIFEQLGMERTCCRNAISNPIPMSLAQYIGPEVELHKILEEPVKKLSVQPVIKEKQELKVQPDVAKKRVSELMGLANNIRKAHEEKDIDVKTEQKKPTRVLYAV
jgi:DNA-directed RNA polymerase subunit N (RpoN/RPB10)